MTSTLRHWLEGLGLSQYAEAFDSNDIDAALLCELTDQALKDIGVVSAGHRLRILSAARKLSGSEHSTASSDPLLVKGRSTVAPPGESAAERRQLTVLFCDLVGSTELSRRLDPEQYRELVRGYQGACGEVVSRFDGHIAQYLGDGLLVYFGFPKAHEDDAERAVRVGLGMIEAVSRIVLPGGALSVRVGIHTGLVVVGEVGAGSTAEQLALGDAPNIAARLQALAAPGSLVLSDRTRRLVGSSFELRDLGAHTLKGIAETQPVWQAVRASDAESRFEAATRGSLGTMVGRELEFSVVLHAWARAKSGKGQVVLLCGEPGIGKSRILRALREIVSKDGITPWQYQCSPYFVNSALYPVIDNFERALKFERDDTPESKLDKLQRMLEASSRPLLDVNLIGRLLSLPADARYGPLAMTPQKQKNETLRALNDLIAAAAKTKPVLMLFEDMHWADPTTLESLDGLLKRLDHIPVLLLATYRPEFKPQWVGQPLVTALTLSRLDPEQTKAIAIATGGGKALPEPIVAQIAAKTDGIPLFVEELTKTILESGLLKQEGDHYAMAGPLLALAIPSTLRDSLMSRLDRLAPVKEVAQIGACIGREFRQELLELISVMPHAQLQLALDGLVASELVFRRGQGADITYTFKHALVQEAAYDSLLKTTRVQIHAQIGKALEERFPQTSVTEPELLAHHLTEATLYEKAIVYWNKAGQRAYEQLALREAIGHFEHGLQLIPQLPPAALRDGYELELRVALAIAAMGLHGWATPELAEHLYPALRLAKSLGRDDQIAPVLGGILTYEMCTGHIRQALARVRELLAEAARTQREDVFFSAHGFGADAHYWAGEFDSVLSHASAIASRYDQARRRSLSGIMKVDPRAASLIWRGWAEFALGYPDRARRSVKEGIAWARECGGVLNTAFALLHGAQIYGFRREPEPLVETLDEVEALARAQSLPFYEQCLVPTNRAWAALVAGEPESAETLYRSSIRVWVDAGERISLPHLKTHHAQSLALLGRLEDAFQSVNEALEQIERPGWEERSFFAEALRTRGWILSLSGDLAGAAENYRASLDVARQQQAKSWELRTATSYAQLLRDQDRRADALELLRPVYDWFTEGFDTKDLKEAHAVLEELR